MKASLTPFTHKFFSNKYVLIFLFFLALNSAAFGQETTDSFQRKIADEIDYQNLPLDSVIQWVSDHKHINFQDSYQVLDVLKGKAYASNDPKTISTVHKRISMWYRNFKVLEIDSSLFHMEKTAEFLEKTDERQLLAETYNALSVDYLNSNQSDKAHDVIIKGLAIFQEFENHKEIAKMQSRLAMLFLMTNDYEKALFYIEKSINGMKKQDGSKSDIFLALIDRIRIYAEIENYEEALKTSDEAFTLLEKYPRDFNRHDHFRGYLLLRRGLVYSANKQYEKALLDFEISDKLGWNVGASEKAKILFFQEKYKEALAMLNLMYDENFDFEKIDEKIVNVYDSERYLREAQIYEKNNRYKEAYYIYKLGAEGIKTNFEDKIKNLQSEAIVKYETGKKDQAIASQEVQLEQKSKIQNLTYGGLGILASFLFGLLYFFRKNKIITRELDLKNQQNEVLLKEIHHRVKNNLQTISSLLSLQSNSIEDQGALDAVQETQNRVTSMALIHQKLYQGENLAAVEMRDYFETIGKAILHSFGEKAKRVELEVDMADIELDVDVAIPIGLITNELITNSLKYAFKEKAAGKISISMKKDNGNLIELKIADDGKNESVGISEAGTGFGTMLVKLLTTQLNGKIEQSTENGTETLIKFIVFAKAA